MSHFFVHLDGYKVAAFHQQSEDIWVRVSWLVS